MDGVRVWDERAVLLQLFFQHLSLGQVAWARVVLATLRGLDAEAAGRALREACGGSTLVGVDRALASHAPGRSAFALASVMAGIEDAEEKGVLARAEARALIEAMGEEGGMAWGGMTGAPAAPSGSLEVLGGHAAVLQGGGGERGDGGDVSKIVEAVRQAGATRGPLLGALIKVMGMAPQCWKSGSKFAEAAERTLAEVAWQLWEQGSIEMGGKMLEQLSGGGLEPAIYREFFLRLKGCATLPDDSTLLQAVSGTGSAGLARILEEALDEAVRKQVGMSGVLTTLVQGQEGTGAPSRWLSTGFQEARAMGWHVPGVLVQAAVERIAALDIDGALGLVGSQPELLPGIVLLGWDELGQKGQGCSFAGKKALMEAWLKVRDGSGSRDFQTALANLAVQIRLAETLAHGKGSQTDEQECDQVLEALGKNPLFSVLKKRLGSVDPSWGWRLASALLPVTPEGPSTLHDLKVLVTGATIAAGIAALSASVQAMHSDESEFSDSNADRIAVAKHLVDQVRMCLSTLGDGFYKMWAITAMAAIFKLYAAVPLQAAKVDLGAPWLSSAVDEVQRRGYGRDTALAVIHDLVALLSGVGKSVAGDKVLKVQASAGQALVSRAQQAVLNSSREVMAGLDASTSGSTTLDLSSISKLGKDAQQLLDMQAQLSKESPLALADRCRSTSQIADVGEEPVSTEGGKTSQLSLSLGSTIAASIDAVVSGGLSTDEVTLLLATVDACISRERDSLSTFEGTPTANYLLVAAHTLSSKLKWLQENMADGRTLTDALGCWPTSSRGSGKTGLHHSDPRARLIVDHQKALMRLKDAVRSANQGRLQYLSGLLHNLSRALAEKPPTGESEVLMEVAGYGPSLDTINSGRSEADGLEPLISACGLEGGQTRACGGSTYLSAMVMYLAEIGDVISTMDDGPTEGHNYFAVLHQSPQELLSNLISKARCREHVEAAAKVANTLGVDLVQEVLKTWVPPVPAPGPQARQTVKAVPAIPNLDALRSLAAISPVRVQLVCALICADLGLITDDGGDIGPKDPTHVAEGIDVQEPGIRNAVMFVLANASEYPTLMNWIREELGKQAHGTDAVPKESTTGGVGQGEGCEGREGAGALNQQIQRLLFAGRLSEALELADSALPGGPSDQVLVRIVEASQTFTECDIPDASAKQSHAEPTSLATPPLGLPISWLCCMRLRDASTCVKMAKIRMHSWPLERAIELFSVLAGRLERDHPASEEATSLLHRLKLCQRVVETSLGREFPNWVVVDNLFGRDPGQLVRRLLAAGAASEAIDVANSQSMPAALRTSARAAYSQELAMGSPAEGKGPAAAFRYLKSLSPQDAFDAGMKSLTTIPSVQLCSLIVEFLLTLREALPHKSVQNLEHTQLGLAALKRLSQAWADRCAHLVQTPALILESLIMAQQTVEIKKLLTDLPALQNDDKLILYARKALGLGPQECQQAGACDTYAASVKSGASATQSLYSGASLALSASGSESLHGVGLVPVKVLSGIDSADDALRNRHTFRGIPNVQLFQVLMDLCSSPRVAGEAANQAVHDLADLLLAQTCEELDWNPSVAEQCMEASDVCLEILNYVQQKLSSMASDPDSQAASADPKARVAAGDERTEFEFPPRSPLGTASSVDGAPGKPLGSQSLSPLAWGMGGWGTGDEAASQSSARSPVSEAFALRPGLSLRTEIETLQKLLSAGVRTSLMDLREPGHCSALMHRLVTSEQYALAVHTARVCNLDEKPYWEAWLCGLVQWGDFQKARELAGNLFDAPLIRGQKDGPRAKVESRQAALRLVHVLETSCPVDLDKFRRLYDSLKEGSTWESMLALSTADWIKRMKSVPVFNRMASKSDQGSVPEAGSTVGSDTSGHQELEEKQPRRVEALRAACSTLLKERTQFAEELLALHAPAMLIQFMFKHGRGDVACKVMFPPNMEDEATPVQSTPPSSSRSRRPSTYSASMARPPRDTWLDHTPAGNVSQPLAAVAGTGATEPGRSAVSPTPTNASDRSASDAGSSRSEGSRWSKFTQSLTPWTQSERLPADLQTTVCQISTQSLPEIGARDLGVSELGDSPSMIGAISGVDPVALAREVENVSQLCDLSVRHQQVDAMVTALLAGGARGKRALKEGCEWLEARGKLTYLHKCQEALGMLDLAGLTCLKLFLRSLDSETALRHLRTASKHFQDALSSVKGRRPTTPRRIPRDVTADPPQPSSITLPQGQLAQYIARSSLQTLVCEALLDGKPRASGCSGGPWTPREVNLFPAGDTESEEDERRRMGIVEELLGRDFSLGFRVLYEFRLLHTRAYSSTASAMATDRRHQEILSLVHNIKGTVTDSELDAILSSAVASYTQAPEAQADREEWTLWFAEGLVELMASPRAKVAAYIQLGDLRQAYRVAKERGGYGDLMTVAEAAQAAGDRGMLRMCERFLGQVRVDSGHRGRGRR